jgi:hypothetical protein
VPITSTTSPGSNTNSGPGAGIDAEPRITATTEAPVAVRMRPSPMLRPARPLPAATVIHSIDRPSTSWRSATSRSVTCEPPSSSTSTALSAAASVTAERQVSGSSRS